MTVEIMPGFTLTDIETRGARIRLRHGGSDPPLLLLHGNPLTHVSWHAAMTKIFLAAAALWCLTGGGVLAEDAMTGTVKPFESVPFAPERDVACLASALETGDPLDGPVDVDPEGTPRMRRGVPFPHRRGAADRRSPARHPRHGRPARRGVDSDCRCALRWGVILISLSGRKPQPPQNYAHASEAERHCSG
jgi:hypothetical protein